MSEWRGPVSRNASIALTGVILLFSPIFIFLAYAAPEERVGIILGLVVMIIAFVAFTPGMRRLYILVWTSVLTKFEPPQEAVAESIGAALLAARVDFRRSNDTVFVTGLGKRSYEMFRVGDMHIAVQALYPSAVYVGPVRKDNMDEVSRLKELVERALGEVKDVMKEE